jgi:hypothetical protein
VKRWRQRENNRKEWNEAVVGIPQSLKAIARMVS